MSDPDSTFDPTAEYPFVYGTGNVDLMLLRPNPAVTTWPEAARYALTFDGYSWMEQHSPSRDQCDEILGRMQKGEVLELTFVELRCCLFLWQRCMRHWSSEGLAYEEQARLGLRLHRMACEAWEREAESHRDG